LHVHSSEPFFLTHFFFAVYVFFYYFYAYMLNNFLLLVAKGRALCKSIYHKFHTHAGTHRHPQKRRRTPMAPNELQAHIYTHTHTLTKMGESRLFAVRKVRNLEFGIPILRSLALSHFRHLLLWLPKSLCAEQQVSNIGNVTKFHYQTQTHAQAQHTGAFTHTCTRLEPLFFASLFFSVPFGSVSRSL